MGSVTPAADRNAALHRKHIGEGGPSFLRHDDVRYCIPEYLRDAVGDKLTGTEARVLFEAVFATAYAICKNSYEAGKKAAEAQDAHQLKSLGYEAAKQDMRRWLDGEDD